MVDDFPAYLAPARTRTSAYGAARRHRVSLTHVTRINAAWEFPDAAEPTPQP